jgi:hypothetical protein
MYLSIYKKTKQIFAEDKLIILPSEIRTRSLPNSKRYISTREFCLGRGAVRGGTGPRGQKEGDEQRIDFFYSGHFSINKHG